MRSRFRTIVLLLLVTLSMQGMARPALALCHEGSIEMMATVHAAPSVPHDRAIAADAHGSHNGGGSHHGRDGAHESEPSDDSHKDSNASVCAKCAACSVASALVQSTSSHASVAAAQPDYLPTSLSVRMRPFGGPERPPRTI